MVLGDFIAVAVIFLVVGGATAYIIKAKKSGKKCIGCPDSSFCDKNTTSCGGNCTSCSGCSKNNKQPKGK